MVVDGGHTPLVPKTARARTWLGDNSRPQTSSITGDPPSILSSADAGERCRVISGLRALCSQPPNVPGRIGWHAKDQTSARSRWATHESQAFPMARR
ncbi:hypothetical protein HYQ44_018949 [Verticillium longisporum]|nr:hypothetical protein HYQ44_018949 [Verticillium longisporum]